MWKSIVLILCLSGYCLAGPVGSKRNMPIVQQKDDATAVTSMESLAESEPETKPEMMIMSTLTLPSNATSIRADITDRFSCENKTYGYYADVDNDCQIFHVCLPVTYADGKENTFRWSFICPEETIFSQDSFTCMRPDDMTITCDESIAYYDLNRNFGMVDSDSEKEDTEVAAESENVEPEVVVMPAESQPEPIKPMEQQQEEEKETPKPVQQTVKVQKPNRRKPGVSYASQKNPNNSYPLRKMPTVQPVMPEISNNPTSVDNIVIQKPIEEAEVKPAVQKISRRPVTAATNTLKDKIQSSKPETMTGTRTQLYNQNRKRPSMFNKKPVEQQEEEQIKPELVPFKVEIPTPQQMFSSMESELSNTDAATQVADSETQASQTNEIFVKPEEPKEQEVALAEEESKKVEEAVQTPVEEPQQVLEAFEDIPAVIAEVIESESNNEEEESKKEEEMPNMIPEETQSTEEETQKSEETQAAEETQTAEEIPTQQETLTVGEESQKVEETHAMEEPQTVEETKTNEESQNKSEETKSDEEVKPVEEVLSIEEPQPDEVVVATEDQVPQESLTNEETQTVVKVEEEAKPEQPEQFPAAEETEPVKTSIAASEPAIFENSEEGLASAPIQTLEEMEEERPADAPESMIATDEMNHPGAMVQQMMEDMEVNKHSVGGFKPVDPVMAHEAEQLIADFINTLRKNDFTNATPGMMIQQHNNDDNEQGQAGEGFKLPEEANKMESPDVIKEELTEVSDKTENEQEIVKFNETEDEPQQSEILETQPGIMDTLAVSQETNAEETEDSKKPQEVLPETMAEDNTDNNESVALKSLETQSTENVQESQTSEEQPEKLSNMMMSNMPQEMFQIPVQVITSPLEEIPVKQQELQPETEIKPMEISATSSEDKLEEETPTAMKGGYKPLSIDDIVELVKERLDHMPQDKMETPMQLEQVLEDVKEDKATEEDDAKKQVKLEEPQPAQSEEEIVMPIYQRTVQPVKVEAVVQTETQNEQLTSQQSETSDAASEIKEKSNRSYRSRSMLTPKLDPRKRFFLFKADKNKSS